MIWKNSLTDTLGVKYPVIQAPMLGVTSPEMVAAVSNAGGLGSLPVGGLSSETTLQLIRKTKALTGKPFAVNLFTNNIPAYSEDDIAPMRKLLVQLAKKKGYNLEAADLTNFKFYNHLDQIEVLIREEISIVSFTFGCLDPESIKALKQRGCTLTGTATCVAEALYLEKQGIDMIIAQGIEAGGHRGSFMDDIPLPQIGLFSLLPMITKAVKVPCIAAGGINNAETIKAAFRLGALAVQIGTAFIGTDESLAIASYKQKLEMAADTDSTLTRAFSGRWARGIRNAMMKDIEQSGIPIPAYPLQNSLTAKLRKLAQQAGDSDYTNLWAGQSAGGTEMKQTKAVFLNLVEQCEALSS